MISSDRLFDSVPTITTSPSETAAVPVAFARKRIVAAVTAFSSRAFEGLTSECTDTIDIFPVLLLKVLMIFWLNGFDAMSTDTT